MFCTVICTVPRDVLHIKLFCTVMYAVYSTIIFTVQWDVLYNYVYCTQCTVNNSNYFFNFIMIEKVI